MEAFSIFLIFKVALFLGMARRNARSDPPPHRMWRRVLNSKSKSWPKISEAQDAQLQKPRPRSPDYPLSISPPGSAHSAGPAPKSVNLRHGRHFSRFLALPKRLPKFASKKYRKKSENRGFWPPQTLSKSFQNASEIDVPTNMRFFSDFRSKKPLSQERRHRFRIGFSNTFCLSDTFLQIAFGMDFGCKKPIKNLSKTTSGPF